VVIDAAMALLFPPVAFQVAQTLPTPNLLPIPALNTAIALTADILTELIPAGDTDNSNIL